MADSFTTLSRRVVFAPLDEPGRTEVVASRIRTAISLGLYAHDEQLPNEITLAAQLKISPVTLREALQVVRGEGLVRTTRGRSGGTFVVAPDGPDDAMFEAGLTALNAIELRDLLDWQTAITAQVASLAAERASVRDLETLTATAAPLGLTSDPVVARRAYSRFVIELAASSRSSRLSRAAVALQVEYAPHVMLAMREPGCRLETSAQLTALLSALADRDPVGAHGLATAIAEQLGARVQALHHRLTRLARETAAPPSGTAVADEAQATTEQASRDAERG